MDGRFLSRPPCFPNLSQFNMRAVCNYILLVFHMRAVCNYAVPSVGVASSSPASTTSNDAQGRADLARNTAGFSRVVLVFQIYSSSITMRAVRDRTIPSMGVAWSHPASTTSSDSPKIEDVTWRTGDSSHKIITGRSERVQFVPMPHLRWLSQCASQVQRQRKL